MTAFPVKSGSNMTSSTIIPPPAITNPTINITTATTITNGNNNQRYRYQSEIQAMMYTFGDVRHPLPATTLLIEDIVHSQIIELVSAKKETSFFYLFS